MENKRKINWTDAQELAISHTSTDELVSASAGSGKTAVMVERIRRLVVEEGVGVNRLLVLTFTNAAAAEMKAKIMRSINETIGQLAQEGPSSAAKVSSLRRQLDLMSQASISTFHSFGHSLIRKYFYKLNLSPNVTFVDEAVKDKLLYEVIDKVFADLYEKGDKDFLDFVTDYGDIKTSDSQLKEEIKEFYDSLRNYPFYLDELATRVKELKLEDTDILAHDLGKLWIYERARSYNHFLDAVGELGLLSKIVQDAYAGKKKIPKSIEDFLSYDRICAELIGAVNAEIERLMDDHDDYQHARQLALANIDKLGQAHDAFLNTKFSFIRANTKTDPVDQELGYDFKDRWKFLCSRIQDFQINLMRGGVEEISRGLLDSYRPARVLYQIIENIDQVYREIKREKDKIDFEDAEHLVIDLLEDPDVAHECREKYQYICVDEYQDCNYMQETIINKIKRDNNLFVVGDVKQSIYRFRHAEPEIFRRRKSNYETYKNDGKCVILPENFRSKPGVLNATNAFFEKVIADYDTEALECGTQFQADQVQDEYLTCKDWESDWKKKAHLCIVTKSQDEDKKYLQSYSYAHAQYMADVVEDRIGKPFYDQGTKGDKVRPYKYSDFVLLVRKRSRAREYEDEFRRRGIPFISDERNSFYESIEVRHLVDILQVIDNKMDDIALLGILRSPFFDFHPGQLASIRAWQLEADQDLFDEDKPSFSQVFVIYGKEADDGPLKDKVVACLDKIDSWKEMAKFMPLDHLLWKIIDEENYESFLAGMKKAERRIANMKAFLDMLSSYIEDGDNSPLGFIEYFNIKKEKPSSGNDSAGKLEADAVQIMTIHGSKGLQFPLVFVALDDSLPIPKKFLQQSSQINDYELKRYEKRFKLDKEYGLLVKTYDHEGQLKPKNIVEYYLLDQDVESQLEEEVCLMYVAWTRAEDELFLQGSATSKDMLDYLELGGTYLDMSNFTKYMLRKAMDQSPAFDLEIISADDYIHPRDMSSQEKPEQGGKPANMPIKIRGMTRRGLTKSANYKEIKDRMSRTYKYKAEAQIRPKYSVTGLTREEMTPSQKAEMDQVFEKIVLMNPDPLAKGTAYHRLMEELNFNHGQACTIEAIKDTLASLVDRGIIEEELAENIELDRIRAFFDWELIKENLDAKFQKERNFVMKADKPFKYLDKDGVERTGQAGVLVQGTIDCFFEDKNGDIILIDYKTNVKTEKLEETYRDQMRYYSMALQRALPGKKIRPFLYSFSLNKALSLTLD